MELLNSFEIEAPLEQTWDLLMDVPRVVPCMPGAELVSADGEDRWKARIKVRLGPMAMLFDADVERQGADVEARNVRLATTAREAKGRGQARATIDSSLSRIDASRTKVEIVTDLALSGRIAQFGRGAVEDVAAELVARFTVNLGEAVGAGEGLEPTGGPAAAAARPAPAAGALGILFGAVRRRLRRIWTQISGRDG